MTTDPDDHRGRALDLDGIAASTNDPVKAQVYATRALTHATLAALAVDPDATLAGLLAPGADVDTAWDGYTALAGRIVGHFTGTDVTDEQAHSLAELLWSDGYRPTWVAAAPQAVSP